MQKREIEDIADSVLRWACPGTAPKTLMSAVRKDHPFASQRGVVRGAFYALIVHADEDIERARRIYDFAMSERTLTDGR